MDQYTKSMKPVDHCMVGTDEHSEWLTLLFTDTEGNRVSGVRLNPEQAEALHYTIGQMFHDVPAGSTLQCATNMNYEEERS